mmetsp:Transcript_23255/g.50256  ORF Transcript_23255/g.50256 Transcript_23255/m.50256 type:complete len:203 (+) Transcript_23255:712-1320(+)
MERVLTVLPLRNFSMPPCLSLIPPPPAAAATPLALPTPQPSPPPPPPGLAPAKCPPAPLAALRIEECIDECSSRSILRRRNFPRHRSPWRQRHHQHQHQYHHRFRSMQIQSRPRGGDGTIPTATWRDSPRGRWFRRTDPSPWHSPPDEGGRVRSDYGGSQCSSTLTLSPSPVELLAVESEAVRDMKESIPDLELLEFCRLEF